MDVPPGPQRVQAKLSVDSRGEEILDLVVISYLVLEKNRRATENSSTGAEIFSTPSGSFGFDFPPRTGLGGV